MAIGLNICAVCGFSVCGHGRVIEPGGKPLPSSNEHSVAAWIEAECAVGTGLTQVSALYQAYAAYVQTVLSLQPISVKLFSQTLDRMGFGKVRNNRGRHVVGLALRLSA